MQTFGVDPTELLIGNLFTTGCRADAAANLFVSQSHRCLLASLAFNTTGLEVHAARLGLCRSRARTYLHNENSEVQLHTMYKLHPHYDELLVLSRSFDKLGLTLAEDQIPAVKLQQ